MLFNYLCLFSCTLLSLSNNNPSTDENHRSLGMQIVATNARLTCSTELMLTSLKTTILECASQCLRAMVTGVIDTCVGHELQKPGRGL